MTLEALISGDLLRGAIQQAILKGVPSTFFAYLLLLPLLASLIASARHVLGLTTYGVFLPAIISVIWVEIGLGVGFFLTVLLFFWGRLLRIITRKSLKRFKINYLPRMAIFLVLICLGLLVVALVPGFNWIFAQDRSIFSFLVLVIILQNLIETQISLSKKEAKSMLLETIIFAFWGYLLLGWPALQQFVLTRPGTTVLVVLIFNLYIGRYVGFRFLERRKFEAIIS